MKMKEQLKKYVTENNTVKVLKAYRTDNVSPEEELHVDMKSETFAFTNDDAVEKLLNDISWDGLVAGHEGLSILEIFENWEITILGIELDFDLLMDQIIKKEEIEEESPLSKYVNLTLQDVPFTSEVTIYTVPDIAVDYVSGRIELKALALEPKL